jgi:uncharacterized protein (DUF362 family)
MFVHDRRSFIRTSATLTAAALAVGCKPDTPRYDPLQFRRRAQSTTAILAQPRYDESLTDNILRGLDLCGLDVRGRRVLLKPNLVEYDPDGVINTHPSLVAAAVEAFRVRGATEVIVGEGPGHRRDTEYLLEASGLEYTLRHAGAEYVDLNTDDVRLLPLRSSFTALGSLYLPHSVLDADLLVSMPKLKTHKWAGATLSMKNLFGIVPGSLYGWPKNVLHWHGISESIIDINAALPMDRFNIVDGVVGMEGNGPIQGTARHSGVLVFGSDPVAVDATCARLMGLEPSAIHHISEAAAFLGNADEGIIRQVGEPIAAYRQNYAVIERLQHVLAR